MNASIFIALSIPAAILCLLVGLILWAYSDGAFPTAMSGALIFLGIAFFSMCIFVAAGPKSEDGVEARLASVKDTYGLSVSAKDLAALEYPYSQPEEGSFESFGTAVLTTKDAAGKLSQRTVTLVWNVDELQLLQGEGALSELTELPRLH